MSALVSTITSLARLRGCADVVAPPSPSLGALGPGPALLPTYRRLVRRVGQEDPLVALVVGRVQPVEDVARHVVLQQGQNQGIKLLVPLLGGPLGGAQAQLLCRTETRVQRHSFRCHIGPRGSGAITIFDDDLQHSVLVAAPGAGKDVFHVVPGWKRTERLVRLGSSHWNQLRQAESGRVFVSVSASLLA